MISSLFGLGVLLALGDRRTARPLKKNAMAKPPPRGVLGRACGVACLILSGLVFVVGSGMVATFEEGQTGFLWELVSGELFILAIVFSALGVMGGRNSVVQGTVAR
jgi:hypothetical protein